MTDKFNLLVVEDDEEKFRLIKRALADANYQVTRAGTGKEALRLIKERFFPVVITEIHLPDIDGLELIKKIKKQDIRINIVVLTAYSFTDSAVEAMKKGAYGYLMKPLNVEELKLVLQRAIENSFLLIQARKIKYYQDMSILDGLTGIYNHRHFHELLDWQITHLRRYPQTISLLMVDIDDFKKYNDTKGHVEGDRVLHNVAQLFAASTRETDTVFRYGGEEFTIVMPQTGTQHAKSVGERLIELVRVQLPVTVSIGMAAVPDHAQTKDDLVVKADRALYRAKASGKNRICVYDKQLDK